MLKHSLFKHMKYIKMKRNLIASLLSLIFMSGYSCPIKADERKSEKTNITVKVDFATTLQEWDGFGVNYVQMAQSIDPINDPQDYGTLYGPPAWATKRSSQSEKCKDIGIFSVTDRKIIYHTPVGSISTFVQNHQFTTGNEEI